MTRTRRTRETVRAEKLKTQINELEGKITSKQSELKKIKEELTLLKGLLKFYGGV